MRQVLDANTAGKWLCYKVCFLTVAVAEARQGNEVGGFKRDMDWSA